MEKTKKILAHTVVELMISVIIFTLFLFGAFAIFSVGLKNYRLLDTKTDAQLQVEIAMGRITGDLKSTDVSSIDTGSVDDEYIVFETAWSDPSLSEHKFVKDNGYPLWQGYVLYYTYPRDKDENQKKLLRKFVPHTPSTLPGKLTDISLYLTDTFNPGEDLRTVARNIYDMEITAGGSNFIIEVTLVTRKKFSERRLAYNKDFSDDVAEEFVTLKASVMPRNTP